MTRHLPDTDEVNAMSVPCARCSAAAGEWCVTKRGVFASHLHTPRTEPIRRAWVDGYEDCQIDLRRTIGAWLDDVLGRPLTPDHVQRLARSTGLRTFPLRDSVI